LSSFFQSENKKSAELSGTATEGTEPTVKQPLSFGSKRGKFRRKKSSK